MSSEMVPESCFHMPPRANALKQRCLIPFVPHMRNRFTGHILQEAWCMQQDPLGWTWATQPTLADLTDVQYTVVLAHMSQSDIVRNLAHWGSSLSCPYCALSGSPCMSRTCTACSVAVTRSFRPDNMIVTAGCCCPGTP